VLEAVNHVYRYLRGTIDLGIHTGLMSVTNLKVQVTVTGVKTAQLISGLQQVTATHSLVRQSHGHRCNFLN
jgi:hypothetical protein